MKTGFKGMTVVLLGVVLISVFSAGAGYAAGIGKAKGQKFKILHHEVLDSLKIKSALKGIFAPDRRQREGGQRLAFDALGHHFELDLESNDRLIAKLPQKQKDRLRTSARLYRGKVSGIGNSWVRLTQVGDRVSGMIWDGSEIYVIDTADQVSGALSAVLAGKWAKGLQSLLIYRLADTESPELKCALDPETSPMNAYGTMVGELQQQAVALPAAARQLDLAVVADQQFVSANSDPEGAVLARLNVVDGIYSEQVGVHLNLAELRLLTSNGSLSSTDPQTLVYQLRDYVAASGFTNPGLTHLFTGRDMDGSVIGIAFIGVLCNANYGVGLSQTRGTGTAGALTVAHELGHNFGAPHDNQSGSTCSGAANGYIMNPYANGSDQFSDCSRSQMQPHIDAAQCLSAIESGADVDVRIPAGQVSGAIDTPVEVVVEVGSNGTEAAANAQALVSLASTLRIVSAGADIGECTVTGPGETQCSLGQIASGDRRTITLAVEGSTAGTHSGSVTVSADNDTNQDNNHAEALVTLSGGPAALFEANFDSSSDGFSYKDDTFRSTAQRRYARGYYRTSYGYQGGGLRVRLGGRNNRNILGMSGGWKRSFSLSSSRNVTLSLRYKLDQRPDYESDEYSEALVAIDGKLIGVGGGDSLAQVVGDGNGGSTRSTGWVSLTLDLGVLSPGSHTLVIGGFNNKKDSYREETNMYIDDVMVSGF